MPWSHCEREVRDDAACPACGITKAQWTVQFDATRTFKVGRRALLNLELLDAEGEPVAGERVLAVLPGGQELSTALDGSGRLSAPAEGQGEATVRFPELPAGALLAPGEQAPGPDAPRPCPLGRKQTFRLAGVLTEFTLVPAPGLDLAGVPWTLLLADGSRREGQVDAALRVRAVTAKSGGPLKLVLDLPDGHHLVLADADGDGALDAQGGDPPAGRAPADDPGATKDERHVEGWDGPLEQEAGR